MLKCLNYYFSQKYDQAHLYSQKDRKQKFKNCRIFLKNSQIAQKNFEKQIT